MVAYIFEPILAKGAQSGRMPTLEQDSSRWFRNQAAKTTASATKLIAADRTRLTTIPMIGRMYLFSYDPKGKKTLPYYDRFPLVLPFNASTTTGKASQGAGFYGLNLHYLPLVLRARLMDSLYQYVNNDKMDITTRIKLSYKLLNRVSTLKYFRPCVKQYLFSHLRSKFFYIEPKEWNIALFLPIDRFMKADNKTVYKESKRIIY
jgi:hypothetical protein